ncbi:MAG: DNA methylase [Ruminococcus sp.]|nr:DNA methylase [Ruminococcus sp.]
MQRTYVAIDLKSYYASVECVERGLDPLDTNLVVADPTRTEKTICLAVSPSLKSFGISGRARLYEVIQRVDEINEQRKKKAPKGEFSDESYVYSKLCTDDSLKLGYIVAPPQMALYMKISAKIYEIYLKYVAPEDIFAYSVDEVFIDATQYLRTYSATPEQFAQMLVRDVLSTTGITATAGIGSNMYLCKIAMDIVAKHIPADENGVRIASLDEQSYKDTLWAHRPITDFWRVGRGIAARLEKLHLHTMGDVARASLDSYGTRKLYESLGKNAELLIDHAWGVEPTTIADVKAYRPQSNSLSSGQVLKEPTSWEHTRLIVWEMSDNLSLDLVDKGLVTDKLVLTIGYDIQNLKGESSYTGEVTVDYYGRRVPKHAHGTIGLKRHTSSAKQLISAAVGLFDRITDQTLTVRRICISACDVISEDKIPQSEKYQQLDLFSMPDEQSIEQEELSHKKEKELQKAMLRIKHKYGKNSILKGSNFLEGATARERNMQIGGHKA